MAISALTRVQQATVLALVEARRPAHDRPFVVIPVGHPAPGARVPDITRKPLDDVLVELPGR